MKVPDSDDDEKLRQTSIMRLVTQNMWRKARTNTRAGSDAAAGGFYSDFVASGVEVVV